MQYYSKKLKESHNKKGNFTDVRKVFNFFPFTHIDHHGVLNELFSKEKTRNAILDIVSSVVAQHSIRNHLKKSDYIYDLLRYFHRLIQHKGYEAVSLDDIKKGIEEKVHVIVAGCQTHQLYESRVESAFNVINYVRPSITKIVFSGAHPPEPIDDEQYEGAITIDEAAEMRHYFIDLQNELPPDKPLHKVILEEEKESTRTNENIKYFFKKIKDEDPKHIFIVSSMFHLPRLIDEAEACIAKYSYPVERITVVASENFRHHDRNPAFETSNRAKNNQIYYKTATYEMLNQLFDYDELDKLLKRSKR